MAMLQIGKWIVWITSLLSAAAFFRIMALILQKISDPECDADKKIKKAIVALMVLVSLFSIIQTIRVYYGA